MPPLPEDKRYEQLMAGEHVWIPIDSRPIETVEEARERARLSVLPLTERDKRFLRAMKIAC